MSGVDIKSMYLSELQAFLAEKNLPKFRAGQIYKWIHSGVSSFNEMLNLPKGLREELDNEFYIAGCSVETKRESRLDGTVKYLFKLSDGEFIESVLMSYHHGTSICISSQVGCKMGCTFCATGRQGFQRNLLPSEMLSQVMSAQSDSGKRISNIVLMGMGEPLDNFDNVIRFLKLVSDENGLNIGMRHISLSTCGMVDKIYELAELKLQLTLSVSLHAPNDLLRGKTMPVNKKWGVDELIKACRYYIDLTGRRISFEYAMIEGINDSESCARELCGLLKGILCHINLIPVNNVTGSGYKRTNIKQIHRFSAVLARSGLTATVRRTLGSDIEASCGQLRGKHILGGQSL